MMQTSPSAGETPEVDKMTEVLKHVKAIGEILDVDLLVCIVRHRKQTDDADLTINIIDWPANERYNDKAQMIAPAVKNIFARAKQEREAQEEAKDRLAIFQKPH